MALQEHHVLWFQSRSKRLLTFLMISRHAVMATDTNDRAAYAARAAQAVAADVRMFSGCKDEQTSADVYDVSSFGLPATCGAGGAGGACTNAMVLSLSKYHVARSLSGMHAKLCMVARITPHARSRHTVDPITRYRTNQPHLAFHELRNEFGKKN